MSDQGSPSPGQGKNLPGFPEDAGLYIFEKFATLNTKSLRPAIKDEELSWCDGFMPIGPNNLRTLYDVGSALYTAPAGKTIEYFNFWNLGSTPICVALLSDGSIQQINTTTGSVMQIAPAGTIINPSNLGGIDSANWSSLYVLICAQQTNGYWIWDGTALYTAGTIAPDIDITDGGSGYTSQPTIALTTTGSGSGTAFTATLNNGSITAIKPTNPGSGFVDGDLAILTVTGGGTDSQASVTVTIDAATGIVTGVIVTNPGSGYPANATVSTSGGGGSGCELYIAAFGANGSIIQVGVLNPGTGYTSAPSVSASGVGGSGFAGSVSVQFGQISGVSVAGAGSGYLANPTLTVIGDGTGAVLTPQIDATGALASVTITNPGSGYTKALVKVTGGNRAASADINLMPFGISGNAMETYASRVWIANKATIVFSAPASASDFATSDGGGAFTSFDSFLNIGFTFLKQSNGFLYLVADSSMSYISGVTTSGTPPTTTFQNQNIDPQIGTPWHPTCQVFSRNIVFGNTLGVYVSYGGAVQKVSSPLDGIYNTVPGFAGFLPSSAVANIFGIEVYMQLTPVIDTYTGQQVNKLLMWNGQQWWTSQQSVGLTYIASQKINSVLTAWGTNGSAIYPLFQNPSTTLEKVAQSKLFSTPHYLYTKTAARLYGMVNFYQVDGEAVEVTIDNESGSNSTNIAVASASFLWVNNVGSAFMWTNNSAQAFTWSRSGNGTGLSIFGPIAVGQVGRTLGMTVVTQTSDMALISTSLMKEDWSANA